MERAVLKLEPRSMVGKKARSLRRMGVLPVHLYGPGIESRNLQAPTPEIIRVLEQAGTHSPVTVSIEGEKEEHLTFVRETQWEAVRGDLLHVDFLKAELTRRMTAEVPLTLVGESPAAREFNGTVVQYLHALQVEALPLDIPGELELDVATLTDLETVLRAQDVSLPADVNLVTDGEEPVARVQVARGEPEVEGVAEGAEAPVEQEAGESAARGTTEEQ